MLSHKPMPADVTGVVGTWFDGLTLRQSKNRLVEAVMVMIVRTICVAALTLVLSSTTIMAQREAASGIFILPPWERDPKPGEITPADQALFMGFCRGVITALVTVGPGLRPEWSAICAPKESTSSQWQAVVVKYMKDHPEQLHESLISLAHIALWTAWPCDKKGK